MPGPLTDTERRVLDYLVDYLRSNTYQPSIREIGRQFNIRSTKTVSEVLQSLANKGWIERDPSRSRGVRLLGVGAQPDIVNLSVLRSGTTPERLDLDRSLVPSDRAFVVLMSGTHLLEEGVRPGDLLIAAPVDTVQVSDGDLLIVEDGTAAVCRRVRVEGRELVLDPTDHGGRALRLNIGGAAGRILGRVATVIRRLPAHAHHDAAVATTVLPA